MRASHTTPQTQHTSGAARSCIVTKLEAGCQRTLGNQGSYRANQHDVSLSLWTCSERGVGLYTFADGPIQWRGVLEEGQEPVYLTGGIFEVYAYPSSLPSETSLYTNQYLNVRRSRRKLKLSTQLTPSLTTPL